ncbi:methyltransferase type 11 [candidate division KSB3 bacterium]|uniref:Methyltransferase type 11 n=1 Tax=candidate division KSB3 bacterium TaxID=2044937 RepID=A0A2G6E2G4_9BACT|nr:MAG: methyltransferase type 11 [candidate division KSB3 bacterium]PIE28826.1 MAG: methyltransferase type 11 [candidate division KSB3 bacterium]
MAEWFEDENFWHVMYPHMFSEARLAMAVDEVRNIFRLIGFHGGNVLDLCCGPGRHSVEFARRGCKVTAVDRTPFLLEKAREKARAVGVEVEWIQEDMRRFRRPGQYDLAVSMLTSLGYFDDPREDVLVLTHLYESLKPGGFCVMDMMGREILARDFHPTVSDKNDDGSILVQRREVRDGWARLHNERILIKGDKALTFSFHQRIFAGQELKEQMQCAGFQDVTLYGDLEGADYGIQATRLVAVGRKAA